jgi:hypothetical protein
MSFLLEGSLLGTVVETTDLFALRAIFGKQFTSLLSFVGSGAECETLSGFRAIPEKALLSLFSRGLLEGAVADARGFLVV